MKLTDEQWVAQARSRVAAGQSWETPAEGRLAAPVPNATPAATPGALACPYCESHPPLEVVRRWEVPATCPLRRCLSCFGFWAMGDALNHGVRDADDGHASFTAQMAPPRCRACLGHLRDDGSCQKCGHVFPPLNCPSCGRQMQRFKRDGVTLDTCGPCRGVWFDVGELGRVYGLQPPQGIATSGLDAHACDDEPAGWWIMLRIVLELVARFV